MGHEIDLLVLVLFTLWWKAHDLACDDGAAIPQG